MPRTRSYTVELEPASIGRTITVELLELFASELFASELFASELFASELFADRRIAGPAPIADSALGTLELRTCVDATGFANAVAIAQVSTSAVSDVVARITFTSRRPLQGILGYSLRYRRERDASIGW